MVQTSGIDHERQLIIILMQTWMCKLGPALPGLLNAVHLTSPILSPVLREPMSLIDPVSILRSDSVLIYTFAGTLLEDLTPANTFAKLQAW